MATITRAELIDRVLENLGIKPAGQSASAEDGALVGEAIDSAHAMLRKEGLAPFATSAIPEWAQLAFRDYVSGNLVNVYGLSGERLQAMLVAKRDGKTELATQASVNSQDIPVEVHYF